MYKLRALVVCMTVCALFGMSFGQENDFREETLYSERDLPFNPEDVKPCLDAMSFQSVRTITQSYHGPTSIAAADFSNDGKQDVVVAYKTAGKAVLFTNQGSGQWSAYVLGSVENASAIFTADLNGDGRVDVIATSQSNGRAYWFKNMADGSWTQYELPVVADANYVSVFVADLNGDNKLDVIAAGDKITFYENTISSVVPNGWTDIPVTYTGGGVSSLSAADIDSDGFVDLVIASSADNLVAWLRNVDGSGTDFASNTIATPTEPSQVFCTDMDGDTHMDVLSANTGENAVALYLNSLVTNHSLPSGNTNSATASSGWLGLYVGEDQNKTQSVFATDLEGNGEQAVLAAVTGANAVNYYVRNGNVYTWTTKKAGTASSPTYVYARDLGGSQSKDVIFASESGNRVGWFEELCQTSSDSSDNSHVLGWALAGGIIGGLLLAWILLAGGIAICDYNRAHARKEAERQRQEAKAMMRPEMHPV